MEINKKRKISDNPKLRRSSISVEKNQQKKSLKLQKDNPKLRRSSISVEKDQQKMLVHNNVPLGTILDKI